MNKMTLNFILQILITFATSSILLAAGVVRTTHDMRTLQGDVGVCSTCHIPRKMLDGPGFEPNRDLKRYEGFVGYFCFACHSSSGHGSSILTEASYSERYVFPGIGTGKDSHGLTAKGRYKGVASTDLGLPYTPGTKFECTTCHNVHDNETNRPFLRANIKDLCTMCHKVDTEHTGGVEAEIIKDGEYSFLKLLWSEGIDFKTAKFKLLPFDNPDGATDASWDDGKGRWNLGLHLATDTFSDGVPGTGLDGEITCVTCHAVHGVQDDSDANTPIDIPRKNLIPKIR